MGDQPFCSEDEVRRIDPIWIPGPVRKCFWEERHNRRNYLLWLGWKLGFRKMRDWYRFSAQGFDGAWRTRIRGLDSIWPSHAEALHECFPQYDWQEWLLPKVATGFWRRPANRRRYLLWLGESLGFHTMQDWYRLSGRHFNQYGAQKLAWQHWRGMPVWALRECFPRYEWCEWLFVQVPAGFWRSRKNQKRYMRWLEERLGYRRPEDWYQVTSEDFRKHHGHSLLQQYDESPTQAVMALVPHRDWLQWRFCYVPASFWQSAANQRRYLRWLGKELGFRKPGDWYGITVNDLMATGGAGLLAKFGSLRGLMRQLLPKLDWDAVNWRVGRYRVSPRRPAKRRKPAARVRRFTRLKPVGKQPICSAETVRQIDPVWMGARVPQQFWEHQENRRNYLLWLSHRLGFRRMEDWYRLAAQHLPRQPAKPLAGVLDEPLAGGLVARPHEIQPTGGLPREFRHSGQEEGGDTGL